MKARPAEPRNLDKSSAPSTKSYRKPVLQFYGTVSALTQGPGPSTNEGQGGGNESFRPTGPSERSIKTNIVQVGSHPLGIGLYLFDYKPEYQADWGRGRQFGVMAEEVARCMPDAISVHESGLKMVDYGMLGIRRNVR